ncbi:MAG: glycosyltransferase [Bacteroidota bacterium]
MEQCLNSIFQQDETEDDFEVVVIDNASTDQTKAVVDQFVEEGVLYFNEKRIGLSHARNHGCHEAIGEWLIYIDDDAKLYPDYLKRILWAIENFDFDCFGGMYYAWYPYGKPKWIDKNFGNKISLRNSIGAIESPFLSGGNFAIKKAVLTNVGGFNDGYGMKGHEIRYGEEGVLQKKLLELGYKLGFDPELKVEHAVLPHKLKFSWHLKSWFAHGRDGQRSTKKFKWWELIFYSARSIIGMIYKLPFALVKFLFNKEYYWQNLVWDVVSPVCFRLGQIAGYFYRI